MRIRLKTFIALLYVGIILVMGFATIAEQTHDTVFALNNIYHTWWFFCLWMFLAVASIVYLWQRRLWHHTAVCLLHVALLLILAGAATTYFTSNDGKMHLRTGERSNSYMMEDRQVQTLPFSLSLNKFEIIYIPGTHDPQDFVSHITTPTGDKVTISMNHILKMKGYRFYQSSFDPDFQGTVLRVRYDPYGTPLTYFAYALLGLSMIGILLSRKKECLTSFHTLYQAGRPQNRKRRDWRWTILNICLWAIFIFHLFGYLLYWYIAGHIPLGNGYETMQFLALLFLGLTILLRNRMPIILPFGFLLAGFTLLVAWLGQRKPQITPLAPVLSSPLLAVHVSIIIMSYALLAFMMLNGFYALLISTRKRDCTQQQQTLLNKLTLLNRLMLYPAVFFLAAGIFLGAVWANISWGKYWSWDPKETWALITLLIYAVPLHAKSIPFLQNPKWFHIYLTVAFLTVLMTYFGVNYFLGGMHSYA